MSASAAPTNTTLWQGDVELWMDENYIMHFWAARGEPNVSVRIIKDRVSGANLGYCFVDFPTHESALRMFTYYNNQPIPGTDKVLQLRWAAGSGQGFTNTGYYGHATDLSIFVGDLAPDVTDLVLLQFFQKYFTSIRSAKISTDPSTGTSRGYGYVRFMDESEYQRSVTEMSGKVLNGRCIKVSFATVKRPSVTASAVYKQAASIIPNFFPTLYQYANQEPVYGVVHVIGISETTRKATIEDIFSKYGSIVCVKFLLSPRFREVLITFEKKADAEAAVKDFCKIAEIENVSVSVALASPQVLAVVEPKLIAYIPPTRTNLEFIKDKYESLLEEEYLRRSYLYPLCPETCEN